MTLERFGRVAQVTLENENRDTTFHSSSFRMKFDVHHHLANHIASTGKVTIYNLSATTESDLMLQNTKCEVRAGYTELPGLIYYGAIMRIDRGREDAVNRYLIAHLRAGIQLEQTVSIALNGVNTVPNAVRAIVDALKGRKPFDNVILVDSTLNVLPPNAEVVNWSFTGPAKQALDELLGGIPPRDGKWRIDWTLKGNHLFLTSTNRQHDIIARPNTTVERPANAQIIHISETSGMINVPEQLEAGLRVRVLLSANIEPDNLLEITPPASIRGSNPDGFGPKTFYADKQWRIVSVRHMGDTWEGDFFTEIEARQVE